MEASNAKAMREALEKIQKLATSDRPADEVEIANICRAALSAPPRNCDIGTAEEQERRYNNFTGRYNPCSYRGYARCAEDCPVHIKLMQEGHGELLCQLEWSQMPYEVGDAE